MTDYSNFTVNQDQWSADIQRGSVYIAAAGYNGIVNDAERSWIIQTNSRAVAVKFEVSGVGEWSTILYNITSINAVGTGVSAFNLDRRSSNTPVASITTAGSYQAGDLIWFERPATERVGIEAVLPAGGKFAFGGINRSGATNDVSIKVVWKELA